MAHFELHHGEQLINIYHQSEIVLAKYVLIMFAALYIPWFLAIKYDLFFQYRRLILFWTISGNLTSKPDALNPGRPKSSSCQSCPMSGAKSPAW